MNRLARYLLLALVACACWPAASQAEWGENNGHLCGTHLRPALDHCYVKTVWGPAADKNITNVWSYITAAGVSFGWELEHPHEFATMETWVSWDQNPDGAKQGESEEAPLKWVEAGDIFGHGAESWECYPFAAVEYGDHGHEVYGDTRCPAINRQLYQFAKTGSVICAYWSEDPALCTNPGELPSGPFTDLETGMEISTELEPMGLSGWGESRANGGIENYWKGRAHAVVYQQPSATCGWAGSAYGSLSFEGGGQAQGCPSWPLYVPEFPEDGSAVRADVAGGGTEEPGAPSGGGGGVQSGPDEFSAYKASTGHTLNQTKVRQQAQREGEAAMSYYADPVTTNAPVQTSLGGAAAVLGERPSEPVTTVQADYMRTAVDVVEDTGLFESAALAAKSEDYEVESWYTHLNLVINARTGFVLERSYGDENTPREQEAENRLNEKARKAREKAEKKLSKEEERRKHEEEKAHKSNLSEPGPRIPGPAIEYALTLMAHNQTGLMAHATVEVVHGSHTVAVSHHGRLSVRVPSGTYTISAERAGYHCQKKAVTISSESLDVPLRCTREEQH